MAFHLPALRCAFNLRFIGLLEGVLFANIRFHDTVSRGRLLNRFGKDFEGKIHLVSMILSPEAYVVPSPGVDSNLPDNFGRSIMYGLSALTTLLTVSVVGGLPFVLAAAILCTIYYNGKFTFPQFLVSDSSIISAVGKVSSEHRVLLCRCEYHVLRSMGKHLEICGGWTR